MITLDEAIEILKDRIGKDYKAGEVLEKVLEFLEDLQSNENMKDSI